MPCVYQWIIAMTACAVLDQRLSGERLASDLIGLTLLFTLVNGGCALWDKLR